MNIDTITIDIDEAKAHLVEYQEAVKTAIHEERVAEDRMMVAAFRAASRGARLIRLAESVRTAGVGADGMPRLAVCRAHAEWVYLAMTRRGAVEMSEWPWPRIRTRVSVRRFPDGTVKTDRFVDWYEGWRAMVPTVPPHLRPRHGLHNYHILWEAEWVKTTVRAPVDPVLLKHVGGDLYAVLAEWDLTEIERAVLEGRS